MVKRNVSIFFKLYAIIEETTYPNAAIITAIFGINNKKFHYNPSKIFSKPINKITPINPRIIPINFKILNLLSIVKK